MTESMLERVATALFNYDGDGRKFSDLRTSQREYWLDTARAAIEAMREPTEEVYQAGREVAMGKPGTLDGVKERWKYMVDAALAPAKVG